MVIESEQWNMMRGVFQYISDKLVGKDVMYTNEDIRGFEKVDANVLSSINIFHTLSRYGKQEEECKMHDYCAVTYHCMGSNARRSTEDARVRDMELWS